jgi:hypothetical protein
MTTFIQIAGDFNDANPCRLVARMEPAFRVIRYSRLITNRLPTINR